MAHHSQPLPHLALGGHTAQTRVNQGLDYFLRFVEAFPSVTDLEQASEDQVLSLWQGLGYYSRAHNLHRAAQVIATKHQEIFPKDFASIRALPGGATTPPGPLPRLPLISLTRPWMAMYCA